MVETAITLLLPGFILVCILANQSEKISGIASKFIKSKEHKEPKEKVQTKNETQEQKDG